MASITGIQNMVVPPPMASTSSISKEMDKYDFLRILAAELQNQDPTDPMDNKDFIAQLASFSTLEQIQNMSSSFDSLGESLQSFMENQNSLSQSLVISQAASLIGKNVTANVDGQEITGTIESIYIENSIPYAVIGGESVPISAITNISSGVSQSPEEVI